MIIPNSIDERRELIKNELSLLQGEELVCPCLGGVKVKIISNSINEISFHASKSKASTLAALNIKKIIKKAVFYKMHLPKDNKQRKLFKFIFLYELHCDTSYGTAKITIGVRESANYLQYCISII